MQVNLTTEDIIEERLIEVLGEGRNQWTYRDGLKSEEDLWDNLRSKISRNNLSELGENPLTDNEFDKIKTELLLKTLTPFDAAQWLKGENGIARITIERDDLNLSAVSLILYSNQDIGGGISSYEVVSQVATKKAYGDNHDRRFDVTLLINGLPIIQIELKQAYAKDGIFAAFNQIKKYAEEGIFRGNIFSTLQLFVISNEQTTRYFANALPKDMNSKFLFSWRTPNNEKVENLYDFVKAALNIPDAHRLIAHYTIVSEDQDNKVLMVLRPYQIHAIEAIFNAAKNHQSGYIWHATGSGKTLTSFVATKLLARKTGIDRTIMLIDRKDLDSQTTSEFTKFASEYNTGISSGSAVSNSLIVGTGSSRELSNTLLSDANSNTIIITTRQKLDAALRYAKKQEEKRGTQRFKKLMGQHIVFVVDECHRALSAEGMEGIKAFFPNSTWYGFTGTPIFEVNKKQAQGQLARTTHDQYGEVLHAYTIKNALEDNSVLAFQVEHENTIEPTSLYNHIHSTLAVNEKYATYSTDGISDVIDQMDEIEKEEYLKPYIYTDEDHIDKVLFKMFNPNNAYNKFYFKNGRPTMSAILTTSSIAMAKKYYYRIKELKSNPDWMAELYAEHPIQKGRTIEDPDFPRIAITYSTQENQENTTEQDDEMKGIIADYNDYFGTSWSITDIDRYNGDINNGLARKKAEFKEFGKQVDLVIVVDRLLTGFDAPTIQTLYVDRNLSYANLIQAFSRTNRTYPEKTKGMIVTFRKPSTMELNVEDATALYSHSQEETNLIYPAYSEAKTRFKKAHKQFDVVIAENPSIDENSSLEQKVDFIKAFQELSNSYDAIVTYDDYNDDMEKSKILRDQSQTLEEYVGVYNTVKGSIEPNGTPQLADFKDISFFSDHFSKIYNVDSAYINKLLGDYTKNSVITKNQVFDVLRKLNKHETVIQTYNDLLEQYDKQEINDDIFTLKHQHFTQGINNYIGDVASEYHVSEHELHLSAAQYKLNSDKIPNISGILNSKDFEKFKLDHPGAKPLKFGPTLRRYWKEVLDEKIIPLKEEL